jgi:hypothetical protein
VEIVGAPPSTTDEAANEAAANAANQAAANAANQAAANADQAAAANQAAANAANVAVEAAANAANEAAANGAANEAAAPEDETTTERPRTTETVSSMTPRRTTRPAGDERPSMRPAMRELADDFGF